MTNYKRGEIVLLPFPYSDQSGSKQRPVVILSTDTYNISRSDIIVAPITSQITGRNSADTTLQLWSEAGLPKPSIVKAVLGTVQQHLVRKSLGAISQIDLDQIEIMMANALGLSNAIARSTEQA